jgi:hypothetical protein
LLNFQGFQAELDTEEDFLSCALKEKETLLLAVIKCIYLSPTDLYFMQDIEDRCVLLMSSTSFVDLPFQEHRMMEKHHMDQNSYIP